MPQRCA